MKIYHETIDKRFIEYLKAIGKDTFLDLFNSFSTDHEFYIDLHFDSNLNFIFPGTSVYRLEVRFEVEVSKDPTKDFEVTKDREFNMINPKTGKVLSCNPDCHDFQVINCNPNYEGLQVEFNKWLYEK